MSYRFELLPLWVDGNFRFLFNPPDISFTRRNVSVTPCTTFFHKSVVSSCQQVCAASDCPHHTSRVKTLTSLLRPERQKGEAKTDRGIPSDDDGIPAAWHSTTKSAAGSGIEGTL